MHIWKFSVGEYFFWFGILSLVHSYFNLVIKVACSSKFRQSTVLQMIIHSVECLSMPSAFRDWDMDNGSVEDHKCRHKKVLLEMLLTIFVRFIIHAIMLVPVIFTGKNYPSCSNSSEWNSLAMKIWERHGFLEVTVGYFPGELIAYGTATTMVRIVVILFPALTFLEFLLYWTYQQWVRCLSIWNI